MGAKAYSAEQISKMKPTGYAERRMLATVAERNEKIAVCTPKFGLAFRDLIH